MPGITLAEVNDLDRRTFTVTFGQVYEHSPWVAERAWERRPFESLETVRDATVAVVRAAPAADQLRLLNAHPDLAGQEAKERRLTEASTEEQASASLTELTPDELARIAQFNRAYRAKFAFPFIIAARNHTKTDILAAMELRLQNDRAAEFEHALDQVFEIARIRLAGMFAAPPSPTATNDAIQEGQGR